MLDRLPARIVSGILTASMTLSLFTGLVPTAQAEDLAAAVAQTKDRGQSSVDTVASKYDLGSADIAMPLTLDPSAVVFSEGEDTIEVTAYMTDIQYLGLTLDQYAAFIPTSVDLDRVTYLTHEQREYIKGLSESQRLSKRPSAEAALKLKQQFVWEAAMEDEDYSDSLSIEPVSWTIYEGTRDRAPMISCRAKLTWTGERPKVTIPAATTLNNNGQIADLTDEQIAALFGENAGSTTDTALSGPSAEEVGTKSIADQPQEVQDFLWELYKEGLVQSKSVYDLTPFEERAKAEGLIINAADSTVDVDQVINALQEQTGDDATKTEAGDTGFNLLGTQNSAEPSAEATVVPSAEPSVVPSAVPSATPTAEPSAVPSAEPSAAPSEEPSAEPTGEIIEDEPPALAPTPEETGDDAEATPSAEPEATPAAETQETAGDDAQATPSASAEAQEDEAAQEELPENVVQAFFGVHMRSNESIRTYGAAYYWGETVMDNEAQTLEEPEPSPEPTEEPVEEQPKTVAEQIADAEHHRRPPGSRVEQRAGQLLPELSHVLRRAGPG